MNSNESYSDDIDGRVRWLYHFSPSVRPYGKAVPTGRFLGEMWRRRLEPLPSNTEWHTCGSPDCYRGAGHDGPHAIMTKTEVYSVWEGEIKT